MGATRSRVAMMDGPSTFAKINKVLVWHSIVCAGAFILPCNFASSVVSTFFHAQQQCVLQFIVHSHCALEACCSFLPALTVTRHHAGTY